MVTLTDIKRSYPDCACTQIHSMQLFVVEGNIIGKYKKYLISYNTIVGQFMNGTWYITKVFYSVSTSRQINRFIRETKLTVVRVDNIHSVKEQSS